MPSRRSRSLRRSESPPSRGGRGGGKRSTGLSDYYVGRFGSQSPELYRNLRISEIDPKVPDRELEDTLDREFGRIGENEIKIVQPNANEDRLAYANFKMPDFARRARRETLSTLQDILGRHIKMDPAGVIRDQGGRHLGNGVYKGIEKSKFYSPSDNNQRYHQNNNNNNDYYGRGGGGGRGGSGPSRGRSPPPDYGVGGRRYNNDRERPVASSSSSTRSSRDGGGGYGGGYNNDNNNHDNSYNNYNNNNYNNNSSSRLPPPPMPPRGPPPPYPPSRYSSGGGDGRGGNGRGRAASRSPPPLPGQNPLSLEEFKVKEAKWDNATRSLYIGNMHPSVSESYLRRIFGKYGRIVDIHIKNHIHDSSDTVYVFINFKNMDMAQEAKYHENQQVLRGGNRVHIGYGKPIVTRRVFIGGLGSWTTKEMLKREFDRFGALEKMEYRKGDDHAYVTYETMESATEACSSMKGFPLGGRDRCVRVDFSNVPQPGEDDDSDGSRRGRRGRSRSGSSSDDSDSGRSRSRSRSQKKRRRKRSRGRRSRSSSNSSSDRSRSSGGDDSDDSSRRRRRRSSRRRNKRKGRYSKSDNEHSDDNDGSQSSSRQRRKRQRRSIKNEGSAAADEADDIVRDLSREDRARSSREEGGDGGQDSSSVRRLKATNLEELSKESEACWHGVFLLKKSSFPVQFYRLRDGDGVPTEKRLQDLTTGENLTLAVTQRRPLASSNMAEFGKYLKDDRAAFVLVTPDERPPSSADDMVGITKKPFRELVEYLVGKSAGGVVMIKQEDLSLMLYIFPKSPLTEGMLKKLAPTLYVMDGAPLDTLLGILVNNSK